MVTSLAWFSVAAAGLLGPLAPGASTATTSLDGEWMLAPDPANVGREQDWARGPIEGARTTPVPWIIQEVFVGYHGVAWYWRDFTPAANPHEGGRTLLRFWAVDYLCDVYVNGQKVGSHEGAEDPFEFDITDAVRPGEVNRLAVRVLNPTYERIDGITLAETPHRNKTHPYSAGSDFNYGGITDSVELLAVPAVRVSDLFARPDPKTGEIRITVEAVNASNAAIPASLTLSAGPASEGTTLAVSTIEASLAPGLTTLEGTLTIPDPRPWDLSSPFLYRVTARIQTDASSSFDERSVRSGFRDFRFENGAFRLNGKRIFLWGSHTGADTPVGVRVPYDLDLLRRDLLNVKTMGFNMIRFIAGVARREQLDLADELGLIVYEECFAGWGMADSERMPELFDHATAGMIRRDRNHPSVLIWGLLNETVPGPLLTHAVDTLPLVRSLDDTRMVLVNSGRWDTAPVFAVSRDLGGWRPRGLTVPCIFHNRGAEPAKLADSTWQPGQFALHPGLEGEPAVVRWTAPEAGEYSVKAHFTGIAAKPTTSDVHILRGDEELFTGAINVGGAGNDAEHAFVSALAAGEVLSFVVGIGDGVPFSDTTALALTIEGGGATYDVAKDAGPTGNPGGPWEYGWIPASAPLGVASFVPYDCTEASVGRAPGSVSNPGSAVWEDVVAEQHPYQRVPHTAAIYKTLRELNGEGLPLFVSEYGIGSSEDLCRLARHYEALGKTYVEDAVTYRSFLDAFLADYSRWGLDDTFACPEDCFRLCLSKMGHLRLLGIDAMRANPNIVGYSLTGTQDQGLTAEGLTTTFRELKPGTVDALYEAFAPLRMCAFAQPVNVYRGGTVHLEAVLSNVDVLKPGEYPLRVQLVRPDGTRVFDKRVTLTVPTPPEGGENAFAIPAFDEQVVVDGPSGGYRFLATLEQGGAATGGDAELRCYDAAEMPRVTATVARFGEDAGLDTWLAEHGIAAQPLEGVPAGDAPILIAGACPQHEAAWQALWQRVEAGATAVVLTPGSLARGDDSMGWSPLPEKGALGSIWGWLYLKDEWAKRHPIFDGLQSGGLMDYGVYQEIIPDAVLVGQSPPLEVVAGAIKASQGYASGLLVSVHQVGEGRLVLSTLQIRENLGKDPVAERLLRNMLRYAETRGER